MYFFKRRERKEDLVSVLLFSLTPFMATLDAKGTGSVAATLVPPLDTTRSATARTHVRLPPAVCSINSSCTHRSRDLAPADRGHSLRHRAPVAPPHPQTGQLHRAVVIRAGQSSTAGKQKIENAHGVRQLDRAVVIHVTSALSKRRPVTRSGSPSSRCRRDACAPSEEHPTRSLASRTTAHPASGPGRTPGTARPEECRPGRDVSAGGSRR